MYEGRFCHRRQYITGFCYIESLEAFIHLFNALQAQRLLYINYIIPTYRLTQLPLIWWDMKQGHLQNVILNIVTMSLDKTKLDVIVKTCSLKYFKIKRKNNNLNIIPTILIITILFWIFRSYKKLKFNFFSILQNNIKNRENYHLYNNSKCLNKKRIGIKIQNFANRKYIHIL